MVKTRQYDGRMMIVRFGISFSPSYSRDFSMVLWYCCVFTIEVSCFRVTTIALSYYHHRNIVVSPSKYHVFALPPSHCRIITIVISWFHHRTIVVLSSHYHVFSITLSCFHHCTIVVSPS